MTESTEAGLARHAGVLSRLPDHLRLIVPGLLLLWFTFPTFVSLGAVWATYNYSHGYLALGLTALLVVAEIRRAGLAPPIPSWLGLAFLIGLVLVTMAARLTSTQNVVLLAWPLGWIAGIWAWSGWANARRFVLPLGYLVVAIPVWDVFVEPLRTITVKVVSAWIRAADLPAFIEGNFIHVPSGTFEVMGGCAGLRYAVVALALSVFVGLFNYRRWQPTLLLTACAIALAGVGNWVRVFITVAVGLSPDGGVSTFVRDYHTLFGWLVFAILLTPLVLVHRKLETHAKARSSETGGGSRTAMPARTSGSVAFASCAFLAAAVFFTSSMQGLDAPVEGASLVNPEVPGWSRTDWQDARLPQFAGATAHDATWYADGAAIVGAYVAAFANQRQGHEVVSLSNVPAGPSAVVLDRRTIVLQSESGALMPFAELEVSDPGQKRRVVWTSLRVAGRMTASEWVAKILQLNGVFRGRRDAQALVLTAECGRECDEARSSLSRFAGMAAEPLFEQAEGVVRMQAQSAAARRTDGEG